MIDLFRKANKIKIDNQSLIKAVNILYSKFDELDRKLEELENAISELTVLIEKKKVASYVEESFDLRQGSNKIVIIATNDLSTKTKKFLSAIHEKYNFTLIIEQGEKVDSLHLSFLLNYLCKEQCDISWIIILKSLIKHVFVDNDPSIVFSYPYPTKNQVYQRKAISQLLNLVKQNVYVCESDLIGLDGLLYHTVKFLNRKNITSTVPLIIGVNEEKDLSALEFIIKEIINRGLNNA